MTTPDNSLGDERVAALRAWRGKALTLTALLVVLSLPDLLSPPISPTILRQTQTYSQVCNFVESGFSLHGLTLNIDGPAPFRMVHEFPVYQAVVGILFKLFGPSFFLGKLVSLVAMAAGFLLALRLARIEWGESVAARAGFFFAACPITLLLSAAFQPDALALALGVAAAHALIRWRQETNLGRWIVFLVLLLSSALAKFTVLVPFMPLIAAAVLVHRGRLRIPRTMEWLTGIALFVVPFVAWNLYRTTLTDPGILALEGSMFLVGDLTRFLSAGYYVKPAFILVAMVLCGAGVPLVVFGLKGLRGTALLLFLGIPFYFILIPTAADQTYYALPLAPIFALMAARGTLWLERSLPAAKRLVLSAVAAGWLGGFAIAAPYTLRHDRVSLDAANAVKSTSAEGDLILVANMHDRGVGIGGFNPTITTLSGRRGWNIASSGPTPESLRAQAESRRAQGARWIVITWFTPDLEPWVNQLLPPEFSRVPRFGGRPIEGEKLASTLALDFPVAVRGPNFVVLELK